MKSKIRFGYAVGGLALAGALGSFSGCSLQPVPIDQTRLKIAQNSLKDQKEGGSPESHASPDLGHSHEHGVGGMALNWRFDSTDGLRLDSGTTRVAGGMLELKPGVRDRVWVETVEGKLYTKLLEFQEILGPNHKGKIKYQLSPDGKKWFYFRSPKWVQVQADPSYANSASEVGIAISSFHLDAGEGNLAIRIFLIADASGGGPSLDLIKIQAIVPGIN